MSRSIECDIGDQLENRKKILYKPTTLVNFVGREKLLTELSQIVKSSIVTNVYGAAGNGKSALVSKFIDGLFCEQNSIIWHPGNKNIKECDKFFWRLGHLARDLNREISDEIFKYFDSDRNKKNIKLMFEASLKYFNIQGNNVVVIDSYIETNKNLLLNKFIKYMAKNQEITKFILLTRKNISSSNNCSSVFVPGLNLDSLQELLEKKELQIDKLNVKRLFILTEGNPLIFNLLLKYLVNNESNNEDHIFWENINNISEIRKIYFPVMKSFSNTEKMIFSIIAKNPKPNFITVALYELLAKNTVSKFIETGVLREGKKSIKVPKICNNYFVNIF